MRFVMPGNIPTVFHPRGIPSSTWILEKLSREIVAERVSSRGCRCEKRGQLNRDETVLGWQPRPYSLTVFTRSRCFSLMKFLRAREIAPAPDVEGVAVKTVCQITTINDAPCEPAHLRPMINTFECTRAIHRCRVSSR